MSEIKIDLSQKKAFFFLFLVCFKIAIFQFIPERQPSGQRYNFFTGLFATILLFPAFLLGMILVATEK